MNSVESTHRERMEIRSNMEGPSRRKSTQTLKQSIRTINVPESFRSRGS